MRRRDHAAGPTEKIDAAREHAKAQFLNDGGQRRSELGIIVTRGIEVSRPYCPHLRIGENVKGGKCPIDGPRDALVLKNIIQAFTKDLCKVVCRRTGDAAGDSLERRNTCRGGEGIGVECTEMEDLLAARGARGLEVQ